MRDRERLQARQVAVMVATQLTKCTVGQPEHGEAHADPRLYLEPTEQSVNDPDALLREEAELRAQREASADEGWGVDLDLDRPVVDGEGEG